MEKLTREEKKARRLEQRRLEKEQAAEERLLEKKRDLVYKDTIALQKRS